MSRISQNNTKLVQLERLSSLANDVTRRVDKMAAALNSFVHPDEHKHVLRAPTTMRLIRSQLFRLQVRAGTQAVMRSLAEDPPTFDSLQLDEWEFLAQLSVELVDSAERAFALEFHDISLQSLIYAIDTLSRISLSAEGVVDMRQSDKRREGHAH